MPDRMGIEGRLGDVTQRLEEVRVQLEALSADIWQAIDHEDPVRLEAGVRFKQQYNERRKALDGSAEQMLELLRGYPRSGPDSDADSDAGTAPAPRQEETVAAQADSVVSSAPLEASAAPGLGNLDQKEPFGFVLSGRTSTCASAWPLFYEALLQELYGRAPAKLSRLADEPGRFTCQGRPLFARVPDGFDDPLPIADAIFAEADLHPEVLIQVIRGLIVEMGYAVDSFRILLKEKKRGTVETLSIAA